MAEWQPIETAPKNIVSHGFSSDSGPRFLGWPVRGLVAGVRYSESRSPSMMGGVVGVFVSDWNIQCKPTHWMPLPPPPTGDSK